MLFRKQLFLFLIVSIPLLGEESPKKKEVSVSETQLHTTKIKATQEEVEKKSTAPAKKDVPQGTADEKKVISKHGPDPLPMGNFALPTSQQISPLVSFGQFVIGDDVLQYYFSGNFLWGDHTFSSTLTPSVLYGLTERADIYLQLPFSPGNYQDDYSSAGIEDIILQFEYAYYTFNTWCFSNQATIVASLTYPSGNPYKNPPTGLGAPSFFIGGTFAHTSRWWYAFFSTGALFPTEDHGTKFGDQYLYQFGYEHVICARKDAVIFAWLIEFNGTYSKRDRIFGQLAPDSGGNSIFITPSFWFSSRKWIIQGGIGIPVVQKLRGHQPRNTLGFSFKIGYTL